MERNVRLLLSYDGTDFHGWQAQPGLRTVQGVLEKALQRVVRHPLTLIGAGRTDAGVHAAGQAANVRTTSALSASKLRHAMGSRLADDLSIRSVTDVAFDFHATRDAECKLYRYRLHNNRARPVTWRDQRYTHHIWERLDVDRMRDGAQHFIGEQDFSAMAGAGCQRETMVRTVFRCDVTRHLSDVRVDVEGSGFLYNQVRNMVGTLIEVGRGRWEPDDVADILATRDRRNAGPTAPAKALSLQWVKYPHPLLRPDGP